MDHDANFVGGRLRLATFLRVVELEMPQRPSRFQRRMQSVGHQSHVSIRLLSGDIEPPIVPASMDEEMRKPTCTAVRLFETESVKRPDHHKETGSLFDSREVTPRTTVPAGSVFEVPHSPTSADPCSGFDDVGSLRGEHEPDAKGTTNQLEKRSQSARRLKVQKASYKVTGSSNTRKKSLPVHGLALLRTTTTDGLPKPSVRKSSGL
jgi:hypothetical protein